MRRGSDRCTRQRVAFVCWQERCAEKPVHEHASPCSPLCWPVHSPPMGGTVHTVGTLIVGTLRTGVMVGTVGKGVVCSQKTRTRGSEASRCPVRWQSSSSHVQSPHSQSLSYIRRQHLHTSRSFPSPHLPTYSPFLAPNYFLHTLTTISLELISIHSN